MEADADVRAYDALANHPRIADLAVLAHAWMQSARPGPREGDGERDGRRDGADADRREDRQKARVAELVAEIALKREDASTSFGNALDVLERGPEDDAERSLARALAAHAVAAHEPVDREDEQRTATDLIWLATHTPFDATLLLDRALGDAAGRLWDAVADRVRRIDQGMLPSFGMGEALVAVVALSASTARAAAEQVAALGAQVHDGKLKRVLAACRASPAAAPFEPVSGEAAAAPYGPVATALLAVTGILLVLRGGRLLGQLVLAYKRPAEVLLSADGGVRVRWRTELLGRTLRDRDVVVPRGALVRATREVRYPRLALYAGLVALALGSYVGVAACVDGARAASPSLIATGLVVVALGLGLDLLLSSIAPGTRAKCRIVFVPRTGAKLCVASVDVTRADALLARLARP